MDLLKYQAFIRIVELGSLTDTARDLGYSQPGISRMLASLEAEVGFPLLIRKKGRVYPTRDALQLLPHMHTMVGSERQLRESVRKTASLEEGTLRLGCLPGLLENWMPKMLRIFLAIYPNIKINIYENTQVELARALVEHRIDFALTASPIPEKYEFYPLFRDHMCVLLPQNHPLSTHGKITLEQLSGEAVLMPDAEADETVWNIFTSGQRPEPRICIHTRGSRIPLVGEGLGVTLAPWIELGRLPDSVVAVDLDVDYSRLIGIAVQVRQFASPAAKAFLQILEEQRRKSPA